MLWDAGSPTLARQRRRDCRAFVEPSRSSTVVLIVVATTEAVPPDMPHFGIADTPRCTTASYAAFTEDSLDAAYAFGSPHAEPPRAEQFSESSIDYPPAGLMLPLPGAMRAMRRSVAPYMMVPCRVMPRLF